MISCRPVHEPQAAKVSTLLTTSCCSEARADGRAPAARSRAGPFREARHTWLVALPQDVISARSRHSLAHGLQLQQPGRIGIKKKKARVERSSEGQPRD